LKIALLKIAINALHDDDYSSPTTAAREFGVEPKTVQRRLRRLPTNRALNCEQEQAIRVYIERLDDHNISAKVYSYRTRAAANYILANSHSDPLTTPPQVSKIGSNGFVVATHKFTRESKAACGGA
ncbi:hypothetical protein MMC31_008191, partial [Peltigera leucophlebia]|nr:hypothetical protein [Peltigera leucophlebia]